jgi:hypothetical protein
VPLVPNVPLKVIASAPERTPATLSSTYFLLAASFAPLVPFISKGGIVTVPVNSGLFFGA